MGIAAESRRRPASLRPCRLRLRASKQPALNTTTAHNSRSILPHSCMARIDGPVPDRLAVILARMKWRVTEQIRQHLSQSQSEAWLMSRSMARGPRFSDQLRPSVLAAHNAAAQSVLIPLSFMDGGLRLWWHLQSVPFLALGKFPSTPALGCVGRLRIFKWMITRRREVPNQSPGLARSRTMPIRGPRSLHGFWGTVFPGDQTKSRWHRLRASHRQVGVWHKCHSLRLICPTGHHPSPTAPARLGLARVRCFSQP